MSFIENIMARKPTISSYLSFCDVMIVDKLSSNSKSSFVKQKIEFRELEVGFIIFQLQLLPCVYLLKVISNIWLDITKKKMEFGFFCYTIWKTILDICH